MKTTLVRCTTMMAIAFWVSGAAANSLDVDLGSSDVQLSIYDNDQSFGGPDRVLFSFTNSTGFDNLVAVYIEGNGSLASIDSLYGSSGVDFTMDQGGMVNMSGSAGFGGSGGGDFGFRARNNDTDGLDQAGEFLGVLFNLNPGVTLAQLDIVIFPQYRCPIFQDCSGNNLPPGGSPVPEPASMILFGIGAGLVGLTKRRQRTK